MNARGDQLVRSGTPLRSSEQIIGGFHVQAGQDCGHNAGHALAPVIHRGGILYFRLLFVQDAVDERNRLLSAAVLMYTPRQVACPLV